MFLSSDELQWDASLCFSQPQQFEIQELSHSLAEKKGCQDWTELWNSFSNAFQTLLFSTPASVRWNENAVSCLPCCLARFLFYLLFVLQKLYQNGCDKTESCFEYVVTSSLCMRMCVCTFMSVCVCLCAFRPFILA